MHITIDYTPAIRQTAGIGRYTRNLVSALAEADRENQYTLFCAGANPELSGLPANFSVRSSRVPERLLNIGWHKLSLPFGAEHLAGPSDIFHSPDFTLPPLRAARGVVTIHDLSFMRLPECADPGLRAHLLSSAPRAVAAAHRVLADSVHTRDDLVELLGVDADKISVVHAGVEARFRPVRDLAHLERVRAQYDLPELFILFVGTIEPRKNLSRLITAYAAMRRQTALPHQLILCGAKGWLCDDIYRQVHDEGLGEDVKFPGFIADQDLPALYTLADLFVFPSLYEGFGLPPLEAMACGTAVVAGNNSSLPEVLGSAALLVDAGDTDAITEAMATALGNASLRVRLADMGRAQAARFSWESAAQQLLRAYELVGH